MAPATFHTLPEELWVTIVSHVSHPQDLKALRLVCKNLKDLGASELFREVVVDLQTLGNKPFWQSQHALHSAIRDLTVWPWLDYEPPTYKDDSVMTNDIKTILRLLPPDKLQKIKLPYFLSLDRETLHLLATTQRGLLHIALGPIHGSYLALPKKTKPWPAKLRSLEMRWYVGDQRDFESYNQMMRNSSDFRSLIIGTRASRPGIEGFKQRLSDTTEADGLISKMICMKSDVPGRPIPFEIQELGMEGTQLYHSGRTFTRYIDVSGLTNLDLIDCPGDSFLLQALTSLYCERGCRLRGFTIAHHDLDRSLDLDVLFGFLKCTCELEYLTISLEDISFDIKLDIDDTQTSVLASKLDRLFIKSGKTRWTSPRISQNHPEQLVSRPQVTHTRPVPLDQLRLFCNKFTELTQLALALPPVHVVRDDSTKDKEFQAYLYAISLLPKLKILRILTYPSVPRVCNDSEGGGSSLDSRPLISGIMDEHMKEFARSVVEDVSVTHTRLKLRLLSFGDRWQNLVKILPEGAVVYANPRCYLVEAERDTAGLPKIKQIRVREVKYFLRGYSAWHLPPDDDSDGGLEDDE